MSSALCIISGVRSENTAFRQDGELKTFLKYLTSIVNKKVEVLVTAKLREAFLFQIPNSFGIFLISFAILKNPFANPLKKVANLLMEFAMFLS